MSDFIKLWRNKEHQDIELLSASFTDFSFSKHFHEELALGIIEKGVEGLDYNGKKLMIPQGNIVAINPGEMHTGFAGTNKGWTYRMFYFNKKCIENILKDSFSKHSMVLNNASINNPSLFSSLYCLHKSLEEDDFTLHKESLLTHNIHQLFIQYGDVKLEESLSFKDYKYNMIIRDYLCDNYEENISLDELSKLIPRDKYQLIRNFKKQFNISPHQFLLLLKIQKARNLLLKGGDIADVALSTGFFDQSHFSKKFKTIYGTSPGNYLSFFK